MHLCAMCNEKSNKINNNNCNDNDRKMQFRKLRYFSNLINEHKLLQKQRQQHQQQPQQRRRGRNQEEHLKSFNKCNLLVIITLLITMLMIRESRGMGNSITANKQHVMMEHLEDSHTNNFINLVDLATRTTRATGSATSQSQLSSSSSPPSSSPSSWRTNENRNSSSDFEEILSAQLKREEEENEMEKEEEKKEGANNKSSTDFLRNRDYDTAAVTQRKTLLSRKRRYLLFPEGSSFQLVYDGIVGIVDNTNYLILGITVALAWGLPSKAPSEMLADIRQQLKDGTFLHQRNDTITDITYVDTKSKTKQKQQQQQQQKSKIRYEQSNPKSSTRPNYVNFSYQKPNYNGQQQSYGYYYTNKRPSGFFPPMHKDYYYRQPSRIANDQYYRAKSQQGTPSSIKYSYYQPKIRNHGESSRFPAMTIPLRFGQEQRSDWRRKDNYYYKSSKAAAAATATTTGNRKPLHPFEKWLPGKLPFTPIYEKSDGNPKYPWWNLANRLTNSLRQGSQQKQQRPRYFNNNDRLQQEERNSEYYQSNAVDDLLPPSKEISKVKSKPTSPPPPRKHRIYPVFGKRSLPPDNINMQQNQQGERKPSSAAGPQKQPRPPRRHQRQRRHGIEDELSKIDRIHIRHHRRTRQALYDKIEKYLDKRGSHGHHCVLRALCETGQKSNEHLPGSFVGELMRAVFTLPEPVDEDLQRLEYKETRYDAAHSFDGSCATRYFHCKESLWKSHFVA